MTEDLARLAQDERALLKENADELGLPADAPLPPARRVATDVGDGQQVSALLWGEGAPRVVLLHGGAQNAHTWDSVVLALGVPALAVDLPGHGRSDWRADRDYWPGTTAAALARVVEQHAPTAAGVVGMSLGGLAACRLAGQRPDLVRALVLVDVTPGVMAQYCGLTPAQRGTTALAGGARTYAGLEQMVAAAAAAAPHRSHRSVLRGVLHNAQALPDGSWAWRYDLPSGDSAMDPLPLWDDLEAGRAPLTLVVGGESSFVGPQDLDELHRRRPDARVVVVHGAGHSVQSDRPQLLAEAVRVTCAL